MVLSIARQSIILKCMRKKSVMVGNYEFYYSAGLLNKVYNLGLSENMEPVALGEAIVGALSDVQADDEMMAYLIKIILVYEPSTNYDDQMKQLFLWGNSEQQLWQVTTNREE